MTHRYDWSKLDAGWSADFTRHQLRYDEGDGKHSWVTFREAFGLIESGINTTDFPPFMRAALAQIAKCRIVDTEPAPYSDGLRCKSCGADRPHACPGPGGEKASDHVIRVTVDALNRWSQDANEVPVRLPPATVREVQRIATEQVRSLADSINASEPPNPRDLPIGPLVRLFGVPWKLGPLAAWTLVNISNHDGRLTVVMKRGRGEVLIETGVDDEGIWERLGMKVVELDKAKAKAEAKEKSDV